MLVDFVKNIKRLDHLIFWLFMYLFVVDYHLYGKNWLLPLLYAAAEIVSYMVIVYINLWVLIPRFLEKKRYIFHALGVLCLVTGYIFTLRQSGLELYFYEGGYWRNNFSMILNTFLFLLISTLYWYFQQLQHQKERQLKLKSEKLEAELKFLKTQISPHFIFNTLNNIYALTLQKHDNAAPMVAKLSKIMRYILYDCAEPTVFLKKELDTLQHYIQLHLLKKPKSENVDFYIEGKVNHLKIAPLLLINFVENCFKHGNLDTDENAWINISCSVNEGDVLHFVTENSIENSISKRAHSGIGLDNTRRQLTLNYPKKHELKIETEKDIFRVDLKIWLD